MSAQHTLGPHAVRMRCTRCNDFPHAATFERDVDGWWCRNCGHREPLTAVRTLDRWMWTPAQWNEIVDCSRKATACREKARISREQFSHFRSDDTRHAARWLLSDARSCERSARGFERRVIGLLRCWAPEFQGAGA